MASRPAQGKQSDRDFVSTLPRNICPRVVPLVLVSLLATVPTVVAQAPLKIRLR